MENENLKPIEKLTPFTKMIMTIGTLPSSFYASMSYYESMVWLYEYLKNEVIPTVNNNAEAVEELQEKYIEFSSGITEEVGDFKDYINGKVDELETYMNNYFNNLDVQEEINNKLDAMATDGTLTNLIKGYVDPIYQEYESSINYAIGQQNSNISNFESNVTNQITTINTKVNQATSGSPLVASSTAGMTDTDRIYVNTTDGNWYYYDGDSWEIGGTYQSSGIGSGTVGLKELNTEVTNIFNLSTPEVTTTAGSYINYEGTVYENVNFSISEFNIKKGYTVKINSKAGTSTSVVAKKNANNTYTSLLAGSDSSNQHDYYYTATEDFTLATSYNSGSGTLTVETYIQEKYLYDENEDRIDEIETLIDKNVPEYTTDSGHYIDSQGNYYSNVSFNILNFEGKAGYTLHIYAACGTSTALLSKVNSDNTYTPLMLGSGSETSAEYSYLIPEDMNLALVYRNNRDFDFYAYINMANYYDTFITYTNNKVSNVENELLNRRKNILSMFSNISCFGDSLTFSQVYTGRDEEHSADLSRQAYRTWPDTLGIRTGANIENISRSGYTASQWWNEYKNDIVQKINQLCIIYLGTNQGLTDTVDTDCSGDDPDNWANNNTGDYARIINKCLSVGAKVLLVKIYAHTPDSNNAIEDLAEKFNVAWVKNDKLTDMVYHYWPDLQGYNNIHYNDLGYNVFTDKLIDNVSNMNDEFIERIYPE